MASMMSPYLPMTICSISQTTTESLALSTSAPAHSCCLCHITDLPFAVKSQVRLFTDDCLCCGEINTTQDQHTLQKDLRQLEAWAGNWGMRGHLGHAFQRQQLLHPQPSTRFLFQSSGAVWKSRWPSWTPRPNEPNGFCGRKAALDHA